MRASNPARPESRRRWRPSRAVAALAAAASLLSLGAEKTATAQPAAASAASSSLVVEVVSSDPSLPAADVRGIVADTLGTSVLSPDEPGAGQARRSLTITIRRADKQILVTYRDATGLERSEMMRLSNDPASNAEAIASAAGALVPGSGGEARDPALPIKSKNAPDAGSPGAAMPPPGEEEPDAPRRNDGYFPFNLSFLYPLALNVGRPELRTNVDIALLISHVGEVRGAQTGVITYSVLDVDGAQVSVAALAGGRMTGAQVGGTFAYAGGGVTGLQASGIFSWSTMDVRGLQFAGIASQTYEDLDGLQLSGGLNIARREVRGAQIAGGLNIGRVSGLQLGLINVSAEVDGVQLGLINVARKVDGLQVGLVNVTESLAGESLGIANILKPGRIHLALWGSNSLFGNAGLKFASKYAYSILSAAIHNLEGNVAAGAGLTLGAHLPMDRYLKGLKASGDLGAYRLFPSGFIFSDHAEVYKARLIASYELAPRLTLFVGGGAHLSVVGDDTVKTSFGPEFSGGLEL